jgi:lipid II isoglutaminyl synthase (glutamine-hydrolysing)
MEMAYNSSMKLTLGWLYYDLMNTYGDRGNILILKHRALARKIDLEIKQISTESSFKDFMECDFYMMGGAEDRQQKIVAANMVGDKRKALKEKIHSGTPGIYICGAYQFLGAYYETADGTRLGCTGIVPFHTQQPNINAPRLIGDLVVKITSHSLLEFQQYNNIAMEQLTLIGFENHGGRTYLDNENLALGKVVKGKGNNGLDHTEGLLFKNTIGTYSHGPILPRNPLVADFLIYQALKTKYKKDVPYKKIDDSLEAENRQYLLKEFQV